MVTCGFKKKKKSTPVDTCKKYATQRREEQEEYIKSRVELINLQKDIFLQQEERAKEKHEKKMELLNLDIMLKKRELGLN